RVLEENTELKDQLKEMKFPQKEFFSFLTSDAVELNGWMIKPKDFDKKKKYPVYMFVYGGPGSQTVINTWKGNEYMWCQYLTERGYIVVSVDNRGTGARGEKFKKVTYLNLGMWELHDQIEAAKYLGRQTYVDSDRIGIWGWSYGGYMSSLCITKGADVFKLAVAVAPVTHWKFYDTIYTERFMRTEQENEQGYEDSAPINFVDLLKGKYLIIHGTADDNVHFQNTVEMVDALTNANKQFDLFFYPNRKHGIGGGTTRLHIYTKITDFVLNNL
ncbi:MAG: S9 family peptidase, partial [Bacteroidetes bacterium]|nr:S9 family peptidase [Bacteroidota bacterium]